MMNPKISSKSEKDDTLNFTLSETNVSIANALRRTILSDIPCVVFHTFPYSENNCTVMKNTSRFNNEIIKHRLSCVPIHITDLTIPLENYLLVVNKKNNSGIIEYITTEDFQIKDVKTDKFLSKGERDEIFPKDELTGDFIEFLRLRPKLASNLDGEELSLTCKFSISTAKQNSAYNQCSKCLYTNTVDPVKANDVWMKKEKELKSSGMSVEDIAFEKKNWYLLDGKRHFIENSFDFKIKTVGVFQNSKLVKIACQTLIDTLTLIKEAVGKNDASVVDIKKSSTTIENCYDVVLHNYDYTIGKVLEYFLYSTHFQGDKMLSFCGFIKEHPHDTFSIIRLGFKNETDVGVVGQYISDAIDSSIASFTEIDSSF
jgi:DNA-directed RNA polymerase subunit L